MWTREELKTRAKINLKMYYWAAFAVSLIFSIISGFGGGGSGSSVNSGNSTRYESYGTTVIGPNGMENYIRNEIDHNMQSTLQSAPDFISKVPISNGRGGGNITGLLTGAFFGVALVFLFIGLALSIFVVPVMEVGKNRFYMESRGLGASAGVGKLFWGFSNRYLNIVWTMFLRDLFIGLGYILCVIPGVYLYYCYYMVPYILSENPDMKPMEAMRISKEMMDGHKFNTWVLELSFIGWFILGILACFVGTWFVQPYYDATFAELYAVLRRPYGGQLSGFGVPDVVPAGSGFGSYVNPENVYNAGGYNAGGQPGSYGAADAGANGGNPAFGGAEDPVNNPDVSKSEGGPGNGYYLNGEFHPYADDEKQ